MPKNLEYWQDQISRSQDLLLCGPYYVLDHNILFKEM